MAVMYLLRMVCTTGALAPVVQTIPILIVKAKNPAIHLALLVAIDNSQGFNAQSVTVGNKTHIKLFKHNSRNQFLAFTTEVDPESINIQAQIMRRKSPLSFLLAIPKSYDLWDSMRGGSTLPSVKLLDYCISVPATLSSALMDVPLIVSRNSVLTRNAVDGSGKKLSDQELSDLVRA